MINLIKATRKALGLSQAEFGRWVACKTGRDRPFPTQRVSEWECGVRSPRKNVRDVCLPVVASEIAWDAIRDVSLVFKEKGINVLNITMSKEMIEVCNTIEARIISQTG